MTRDYDLHDIIALHPEKPPKRIPSAFVSNDCDETEKQEGCEITIAKDPEEKEYHNYGNFQDNCDRYAFDLKISCHLNSSIEKERECGIRETSPDHCGVIRHGAQANYLGYQKVTQENLIPALVDVDEELAVIEPLFPFEDSCHYYLLGQNPEHSFLKEYEALYHISDYHYQKNQFLDYHPEKLALENARTKGVPKKLLSMQKNSIKRKLKDQNKELKNYFLKIEKKKSLSLESDCLEKLYKLEQFERLTQEVSTIPEDYKRTLSLYKNLLCSSEITAIDQKSKTCLSEIKEKSKNKESSATTWKAMRHDFCHSLKRSELCFEKSFRKLSCFSF